MQVTAAGTPAAAGDPVYATSALRAFVERAAAENRAPPITLAGYTAAVESELAMIVRDSLGRELVGQVEQLAVSAEWDRSGLYDLHVVGYRSQTLGAPYSALTFTKTWTVPTLYGNRLTIGMNAGRPRQRDSTSVRRRAERATAASRDTSRDPFVAVHPLSPDRDRFYRFSGGDTVAILYSGGRSIRVVRVRVEAVRGPRSNFDAFVGEMHFDADRHQLVRMRGRIIAVRPDDTPLVVRALGARAAAYIEFENAEVDGRYWLPAFQRSEFQAQLGAFGVTRPIYRIVSRFRDYKVRASPMTVAHPDSAVPVRMSPTRARLTFAARDTISAYSGWANDLGRLNGSVSSGDFDDLAPDVWKTTGRPRMDFFPRHFNEVVRYNRVEGLFTGAAGTLQFRDLVPGLAARGNLGVGWADHAVRGGAALTLARQPWTLGARVDRALASTNDFESEMDPGLSVLPLLSGVDDIDYVDRWTAALSATRIVHSVKRAVLVAEAAAVRDETATARLRNSVLYPGTPFRSNRGARSGSYARARATMEYHPDVTGASLAPGIGARLRYEIAHGDLRWQRAELRVAARRYWRGLALASRVDGGVIVSDDPPPQSLYELGGGLSLPAYGYKEFAGDRAALGRALLAYQLPVLRAPVRVARFVFPGLSPGIGTGVQSGWAEASTDPARRALLALGGDGITSVSRPTERVRATLDARITVLSGAIGAGLARPIDHAGRWKPFFVWGASF